MRTLLATFLATVVWCFGLCAARPDYADHIASLIDPAKLAKLGTREANPRVQKCVYWLATARKAGQQPEKVLGAAVSRAGYRNHLAAKLTKDALLRNLDIAEKLGCLDTEGLGELRRGKAATVRHGPFKGDQLSVDHIIPRAVAPELDNVIANLELMPQRMNAGKSDKVGDRQRLLANQLFEAGLLSNKRLKAVQDNR